MNVVKTSKDAYITVFERTLLTDDYMNYLDFEQTLKSTP